MTNYEVPSLKGLPQTTVDGTTENLTTRLNELGVGIDFNRQAAFRLLPYLHGLLLASTVTNLLEDIDKLNLESLSKGELTTEQADKVAGMFGMTREAGTKNTINVLFSFSSAAPFSLSTADYVYSGSAKFSVAQSVSVRSSRSTVVTSTDLVLSQIGTGRWGIVLSLTARAVGSEYNLAVDTLLTLSKSVANLVEVKVVKSAGTGKAAETDEQLADRALSESSVKSWAGRNSFEALARSTGNYPELVDISVAGFGDAEQQRDRRGVLPGATGGRVDLWVKNRAGLYSEALTVSAVLISKVGSIGTWSFTLGGTAAPGIYKIVNIVAQDNQSGTKFYPSSEVFVLAADQTNLAPLEGERYIPDVRSVKEAAFSEFCNLQVLFEDNRYDVTSVNVGASRSYLALAYFDPKIAELQQYLGSPAIRSGAGDVLVRHAAPAQVFLALELSGPNAASSADAAKSAVIQMINGQLFTKTLTVADVAAAARSVNPSLVVAVTSMTCSIKTIDNDNLTVGYDGTKITIPDDPDNLLTWKTVAFYSSQDQVSVTIR
jgi:hypothetical protein